MDTSKPMNKTTVTLRAGRPEEAELLGTICYEAFSTIAAQHNFPTDFPNADAGIGLISMMLSMPNAYSVVAEFNGRAVGSNFLWEGDVVKGVGPITVDPKVQNSSIGRALMEDVLQHAKQSEPLAVRLVQSAYHNRSLSLYTKLGFDAVEPLSAFQGTPLNRKIEGLKVRPMTVEDLTYADELSLRVHGHTRHNEVSTAIAQGTARVAERDGRITGYSTSIGFFGHAVAETNQGLIALIAATDAILGPGFLLPTRNGEVMRWCLNNGLRIIQPLTLMSMGFYQEPKGAFMPSVLY